MKTLDSIKHWRECCSVFDARYMTRKAMEEINKEIDSLRKALSDAELFIDELQDEMDI